MEVSRSNAQNSDFLHCMKDDRNRSSNLISTTPVSFPHKIYIFLFQYRSLKSRTPSARLSFFYIYGSMYFQLGVRERFQCTRIESLHLLQSRALFLMLKPV